jgi:enoyl-CoA hydratase/carnithine racemase
MALLQELQDRVFLLTINRPEAMNAIDPETSRELSAALERIDQDPDVWVGVITGAGNRAFSAGADLKQMHRRGRGDAGPFWAPWRPSGYAGGQKVSKPLIAAINGYCLAGGLELAEFCDIRICAENAQFGCPEVKWSVLHGYGALRLPRMIPHAVATKMLFTGEFIDAREAHRIGLVSDVVLKEDLLPLAFRIAERICRNGPIAVRMTKELAWMGDNARMEDGLRLYQMYNRVLHESADAQEGPRAFEEKRTPNFTGR